MAAHQYPIRAVAKLTGLPLDTLRAWERRYAVVTPMQGPRGRVYSEQQVQRLVLLRDAVEQGYSIGQVAAESNARLRSLLKRTQDLTVAEPASQTEAPSVLEGILHAVERFDYSAADRELGRLAATLADPRRLVHDVALPLMRIAGNRWHEGRLTIAQEHMVSMLLSNLLASLVRHYTPLNPAAKVLLATPSAEDHGFPIMAAAMLCVAGGLGVVHLGTNLPGPEVVYAQRKSEAKAVLMGLMREPSREVLDDLRLIARKLPSPVAAWLGGPSPFLRSGDHELSRWVWIKDFHSLEQQLTILGAKF